MKTKWKSSFR